MSKYVLLWWVVLLFIRFGNGKTYLIDAIVASKEVMIGHLKMGDPGPAGREIQINSQYMTLGGKPIIPVMGEIHFSRYPKEQWEDVILKIKANGIKIIACYVFWIHHEEIEGQFDWSGNKDLRSFIKICQKHDLWTYPRIGPWCHGEVRNGGTPDWIFHKKFLGYRSNHPVYQQYVDRLYKEIAYQLKGLLYKDGGPVIGLQFENEYWRGAEGEAHIIWLKETARKYGLDVPMYTVTGWQGASVPQDELIPMWGGYPAEPWATHTDKIEENSSYTFEAPMNDESIGNKLAKRYGNYLVDYTRYPYFTCELGVGNQLSEHRRPIIGRFDGLAIATIKTGSGSNLPGYYMFAGGMNPVGIYTTMEENQDETGYWNEYPDISYDFQAAIRETGEIALSYHQVKKLHYFLNEFGSELAPMLPVIPSQQNAKEDLQYTVRVNENSGFIFGLNYYRGVRKPEQKNVQFNIQLTGENLLFPTRPVDVPDSCIFIWPINFKMNGILLKYATAQPLCKIEQKDCTDWFFIQNLGITPELCFDATAIKTIEAVNTQVIKKNNQYIISGLKPSIDSIIKIKMSSGQQQDVIVIPYEQSNQVWLFDNGDDKLLFISDANLYLNGNQLHLYSPSSTMKIISLSDATQINAAIKGQSLGKYQEYQFEVQAKNIAVQIEKRPIFKDAQWLKASVDEINDRNKLFHKIFLKEFNLGNPSPIKNATLYIIPEIPCNIRVNSNWMSQKISKGVMNRIDISGYVTHGDNVLLVDFPFTKGKSGFAAKLEIDYFNSDQIEIFTDQSWLTVEHYTVPAPWSLMRRMEAPEFISRNINEHVAFQNSEWLVTMPNHYMDGLSNLYLHVNYVGDKGRCRLGHRLISDNFNNGTPWLIEMKHLGSQVEMRQLQFELLPMEPGYKIYFEKEPAKEEIGTTNIQSIQVIPEYSIDISLNDNTYDK